MSKKKKSAERVNIIFSGNKFEQVLIAIGSIMFAIMTACGICYDIAPRTFTIVAFIKEHTISFTIAFLTVSFGFYFVLNVIFSKIDTISSIGNTEALKKMALSVPLKEWMKTAAVIFLCWSPYLIIFFPGTFAGTDFFWQLLQGCGALPLSNHHPVFGSLVFGLLYRIGYAIGGAALGLFTIVLMQVMLMTGVLGYCITTLKVMGAPKWYYRIAILFVSICPVYPMNVMWAVKDSFFSAIAVMLAFSTYIYTWGKERGISVPAIASLPAIVIMSILVSIYRNGVTIIATFFVLTATWFYTKYSKETSKRSLIIRGTASMLTFLVAVSGWGAFLDKMGVYPTNFAESTGIPSRQILKCYEQRQEKFSDKDLDELRYAHRHALENGLTLEVIANRNDSRTADPIKPTRFESRDDIKRYISLWIRLGVKNPEIYVDEALRGSYAYWWPGYDAKEIFHATPGGLIKAYFDGYGFETKPIKSYFGPLAETMRNDSKASEQTMKEYLKVYTNIYEFTQIRNKNEEAAEHVIDILIKAKNAPIISVFLTTGFYSWILMIDLLYVFSRKRLGRFTWPTILIVCLACLSPVNGYMRYILPVVVFSVLLSGMCFVRESTDS